MFHSFLTNSMQQQKIFCENRLTFFAKGKNPERPSESPEMTEAERKVLERLERVPRGEEFTSANLKELFGGSDPISKEALQAVSENYSSSREAFGKALTNE